MVIYTLDAFQVTNYNISTVWHGDDQLVALLRCH